MSIIAYTGRPGTGKTYSMVQQAIKLLNRGKVVYSNFHINWQGAKGKRFSILKFRFISYDYPKNNLRSWTKLNDILEIKKGYVIMDEAHLYMNSRRWKEMPMEFMRKLAQHRKDGIHIVCTVQNIKRLDVIVRELVDYWYDCRRFFFFWFKLTEYDVDEDEQRKKPLSWRLIRFSKKRAMRYDTLEKVGSVDFKPSVISKPLDLI